MISVVIPLYNKQQSAARAIRSVLEQTYQDFELIVIDDGSTDGSLQVARSFTDPRLVVLTQQNEGVASARNRGVRAAKGNYVSFLDADDEYAADFLTQILQLIRLNHNAALFACRYKEVDELGQPFLGRCDLPDNFCGEVEDFFAHYQGSRSLICSSNICARRDLIISVGGFPDGERIGEDIYLWLRLALQGPVMFSGRILSTVYRNAENRTISSGSRVVPFHTRYFLTNSAWQQGQDKAVVDQVLSFIYHNGLINVCGALMVNNKTVAEEFVRLIYPKRKWFAFAISCLSMLPASVFLLGKKVRNFMTIRSIDAR